ncbi:MAG: cellulase family glycosylhydrolase [Pseudomonadota bacterium]
MNLNRVPSFLFKNPTAWLHIHQTLIEAIRGTGNNNPILVEGWAWGQDAASWGENEVNSAILGFGDQIDGAYENIIFSHHVYDQWRGSTDRLKNYVDGVLEKGYALVVGEYSTENNDKSTMPATESMFEVNVPRGVGRIVWTWIGSGCGDGRSSAALNAKERVIFIPPIAI